MITQQNIWAQLRDLANNNIFNVTGSGAPTSGASGTGVGICGPGSEYTDSANGNIYINVGTLAVPSWSLVDGFTTLQQATGVITSANITGTSAGQLGHANGVILIPALGAHVVTELVSVSVFYRFAVAAYTGGGNLTINNGAGGSALSGLVSAANSLTAASSKGFFFAPLTTVGIAFVENGPINLVSSAAPTQPGTAAGVILWFVNYRQYNTGF